MQQAVLEKVSIGIRSASPITVKRWSNKIDYSVNFSGRLHFHLNERKTCWCLCSLAFPYTLLFDWQRKCHQTPKNKIDLKYLPSPHNLIAVYSCIKGTTPSLHWKAGDEWISHWCGWTTFSINWHLGRGYRIILF